MAFEYDKTQLLKSWEHCSLFIIEKISDLDTDVKELKTELRKISSRLTQQELKMTIIGGVAGTLGMFLARFIMESLGKQ